MFCNNIINKQYFLNSSFSLMQNKSKYCLELISQVTCAVCEILIDS